LGVWFQAKEREYALKGIKNKAKQKKNHKTTNNKNLNNEKLLFLQFMLEATPAPPHPFPKTT